MKAQDYSSRGTDFWTGYGLHSSMFNADGSININGGSQQMVLYFTSVGGANVTVDIPSLGWTRNYFVAGNSFVQSDPIPKTDPADARIDSEGVFNSGIHITSDQDISVVAQIYNNTSAATTLLLPTNILGQNYFTLNFTQRSDVKNSNSYCFIVASKDNTVVVVTPSVNTINHPAKIPFTQTLQKGQILSLIATNDGNATAPYTGGDLTGTHIETENFTDSSGCNQIAVFCGSSSVSINCQPNGNVSSDNIFQQALPAKLKGKEFISIPSKNYSHNIYRILVYDTGTVVTQNGILLAPVNNKYYQFETNKVAVIQSNKLVSVAQYFSSAQTCNNGGGTQGDPEMIYLTPIQQSLNNAAVSTLDHSNSTEDYVNILKLSVDSFSVTLDNNPIQKFFSVVPFDTNYQYAQIPIDPGVHTIHADSGFAAVVYGFGNFESYGYNAGFSSVVIPPKIQIQNPYGSLQNAKTCDSTQFKLSVTFPFTVTSLRWDFLGSTNITPHKDIFLVNPQPDPPDADSVDRYTLPGFYKIDTVKDVPVLITVSKPTQDGCSDTAQYLLNITVYEKPAADWVTNDKECENNQLRFNDATNGFGVPINQWFWKFGNGKKDSTESPVETFAAGNYLISLRTVDTLGCYDDTSKPIFIASIPNANFGVAGNDCVNSVVNFTDSSQINIGTITQWFWNFGDGASSSFQNPSKVFTSADSLTVQHFVLNEEGCSSDTVSKPWIVYAYPTVQTPSDTFVVVGNNVQLRPIYGGSDLHYLWFPPSDLSSDSVPYPYASPKVSTFYQETVTGAGGCVSKSATYVYVIQFLQIPNAFSPNGDGINDKWMIKNIERYADVSVKVYNRYGQPVFLSTGYYNPWDGTYNGKQLPVGTYYYVIDPKNRFVPISTGYVVIVR